MGRGGSGKNGKSKRRTAAVTPERAEPYRFRPSRRRIGCVMILAVIVFVTVMIANFRADKARAMLDVLRNDGGAPGFVRP